MRKITILPGVKFGRLTVINDDVGRTPSGKRLSLFSCECGSQFIKSIADVKSGHTSSCGCYQKEISAKRAKDMQLGEKARKREPRLGTAHVVWLSRYTDGCSFEHFLKLSQQNCFYCEKPPSNRANAYSASKFSEYSRTRGEFIYNGLDRIDSTKPHSEDNVVSCCYTCNKAKLDTPVSDFYSWIEKVHEVLVRTGRINNPCTAIGSNNNGP
ncbi:hypothetical protein UFOVP1290_165 [uncultured Caudovirales phage]|uniref:Uncharacterized protein n=1 Tax=uncultured Caudovirales phage TaxID=2100421 RepID=A0A6J5RWK5_9CAUD|nr:hypothetical protein UFOVP1290_165 [uncultured Caudovirales phage]